MSSPPFLRRVLMIASKTCNQPFGAHWTVMSASKTWCDGWTITMFCTMMMYLCVVMSHVHLKSKRLNGPRLPHGKWCWKSMTSGMQLTWLCSSVWRSDVWDRVSLGEKTGPWTLFLALCFFGIDMHWFVSNVDEYYGCIFIDLLHEKNAPTWVNVMWNKKLAQKTLVQCHHFLQFIISAQRIWASCAPWFPMSCFWMLAAFKSHKKSRPWIDDKTPNHRNKEWVKFTWILKTKWKDMKMYKCIDKTCSMMHRQHGKNKWHQARWQQKERNWKPKKGANKQENQQIKHDRSSAMFSIASVRSNEISSCVS